MMNYSEQELERLMIVTARSLLQFIENSAWPMPGNPSLRVIFVQMAEALKPFGAAYLVEKRSIRLPVQEKK